MATFLDLALRRDPESGHFDVVVEGGDFVFDHTPVTGMVVALGTDRRARPDDRLPSGELAKDSTAFGAKRGWVGDAVSGDRLGTRRWLLVREKQLETVRLRAESYDTEGMSWFAERAVPFSVGAEWVRRGWLRTTVRVGEYAVAREQQVAG